LKSEDILPAVQDTPPKRSIFRPTMKPKEWLVTMPF
jgi:hypothetical protein